MRLFISVPLPAELESSALDLQRRLRRRLPDGVKWTEQQQLHFTLHFMGDAGSGSIAALRESLSCAAAQPSFSVELSGCGAFPSAQSPQVLWAGVQDPSGGLSALHGLLGGGLKKAGFETEPRPFAAHLTLGRVKNAAAATRAAAALAQENSFRSPQARLTAVELVESKLSAQGPVYSTLARVELAG